MMMKKHKEKLAFTEIMIYINKNMLSGKPNFEMNVKRLFNLKNIKAPKKIQFPKIVFICGHQQSELIHSELKRLKHDRIKIRIRIVNPYPFGHSHLI